MTLRIFDAAGRQVAAPLDQAAYLAGFHDVVWRGTGQASGVYFYRLDAGAFSETRKMVLLK